MRIIRTDKSASCEWCGTAKDLVICTEDNEQVVYCNTCLNDFEQDENYMVVE